MVEQLKQYLNEIATYLVEGEIWHRKVANELRKMPNKRGYARTHYEEGKSDAKLNFDLLKVIRDNLKYSPMVDMNYVVKAEMYTISTFEEFKQHFGAWIRREQTFLRSISSAIEQVRNEDMNVYSMLCALSKEVKEESIRAEWIMLSLEDDNWGKHHCAVVSKWLHEQCEAGLWPDINIG